MLAELHELLTAMIAVKRDKLAAVLAFSGGTSPEQICDRFLELRRAADGRVDDRHTYKQIVTDAADKIGLEWATVEGHEDWANLRTEVIEEQIARRLYAGAKQLPEARSVALRPVRVLIKWSLADLLAKISPHTTWSADNYAARLAGASFVLSPEWNTLLAGVMFVHLEVR